MLILKEKINSVMADEFLYNASFAKRSGAVFVAFLCVNFYIWNKGSVRYTKGNCVSSFLGKKEDFRFHLENVLTNGGGLFETTF